MNAFLAGAIFAGIVSAAALPKDAEIISSKGDMAGNEPVGNVKVYFTDGHKEMWTRKGNCMQPKVSESGQVGWLYSDFTNESGSRVFSTVRVVWPDEHHRDFNAAEFPYIDAWDFADNDTSVIIRCGRKHGPSHFYKYRLSDGSLLAEAQETYAGNLPDWAMQLQR